jgi:hypothetical protein
MVDVIVASYGIGDRLLFRALELVTCHQFQPDFAGIAAGSLEAAKIPATPVNVGSV